MTLVEIQKAIITDDLAAAISGMLSLSTGSRLQNQVISVSGRYHNNEKGNNLGTLSSDHYTRTRNQLRNVLQELIKNFPDYTADVYTQANQALMAENDGTATTNEPKEEPAAAGNGTFKILMLSSNPSDTAQLELELEHGRISRKIQNTDHAADFPIRTREAVTLSGFSEALLDEQPSLVHFSGHGELKGNPEVQSAISRGLQLMGAAKTAKEESTGIILTSEDHREAFFVSTEIIKSIFETIVEVHPIEAVVFNSCYSEAQAEALAKLIPNVIGTSWSVNDKAAIAFATGFYSWLARKKPIELAWKNGRNMAMGYGEPKERFVYFKNGEKVSAQ